MKLVVREGRNAGAEHAIPPEDSRIVLGRLSGCDIQVTDPQASREHAEIRNEGGCFILRDLGSANGTFVVGGRVEGDHVLRPGDSFHIGATVYELAGDVPGGAPSAPAAPPEEAEEAEEAEDAVDLTIPGCGEEFVASGPSEQELSASADGPAPAGSEVPGEGMQTRCHGCGRDLAAGSVVCVACGFNLKTGKRLTTAVSGGDDREGPGIDAGFRRPPPRPEVTPGRLAPGLYRQVHDPARASAEKTPTIRDFLQAPWSRDVIHTVGRMAPSFLVVVILSLVGMLALSALATLQGALLLFFLGAAETLITGLELLLFTVLCRHAFAACSDRCEGVESAGGGTWTYPKTVGLLLGLLLLALPFWGVGLGAAYGLLAISLPADVGEFSIPAGVIVAFVAVAILGYFVFVMGFLSVSQVDGEVHGLNPLRVFAWIGKLFVPYAGVFVLIVADIVVAELLAYGVIHLLRPLLASAPVGKGGSFPLLVLFLTLQPCIVALFTMQPLALMANAMGMLYVRYRDRLE